MTFKENRTVYLTQDEDLVATPTGVSDNVGTLFNRSTPAVVDAVDAVESPKTRTDAFGNVWETQPDGRQKVISGGTGEKGTIATTSEDIIGTGLTALEESQQNLKADAQSQVFAAIEQQRKANIDAGKTATSNIDAPLNVRRGSQIGVRGGFTAGTANRPEAVALARSKAIQNDPRVVQAANDLRNANARLNAASSNVQTLQQEKTNRLAQQAVKSAQDNFNAALEDAQPTAQQDAQDAIDSTFDNFSVEDIGNMSTGSITSLVNSIAAQSGVTDSSGLLATTLAKKALADEIAKTKDEDQKAVLLDQLSSLKGLPQGVADVSTRLILDQALSKGDISQELHDSLVSGAASVTPGGLALPKGTKYETALVPKSGNAAGNGVSVGVNVGEAGGQCGRGANDLLGSPSFFGDSVASKASRINSQKASAGSYVVMDTGTQFGHVGFVEQVYLDGSGEIESIDVTDSNWHLDEKWDKRNVKMAGNIMIQGYYNPSIDPNYNPMAFRSLANKTHETFAEQYANGEISAGDVKTAVEGDADSLSNIITRGALIREKQQITGVFSTLSESEKIIARQSAEYKINPEKATSIRRNRRQKIIAAAAELNPNFDQFQIAGRVALKKDFAAGNIAQNIRAMNTVIAHIEELNLAGKELGTTFLPKYNTIANALSKETGHPEVKAFNIASLAVAAELAKTFQGSGVVSERQIQEWKTELLASESPEQMQATYEKAIKLVAGRISAISDQYTNTLNEPLPRRLLSDKSVEIINNIGLSAAEIEPPPEEDRIFTPAPTGFEVNANDYEAALTQYDKPASEVATKYNLK